MRTAIIIPARLQATRLPGKPLALLGELPLVVCVARQAQRCPEVDMVAIATDAPAIADAAQQHGIAALMTGKHHPSGTDRVWEAAEALGVEYIVNVQGDEPFVHPNDLHALTRALRHANCDMVTLQRPAAHPHEATDPHVTKVVTRDDGMALYFSRAAIPYARGGHKEPEVACHIGVYGYRRAALARLCAAPPHPLELAEGLEQLRALAMGLRIAVLPARGRGRGIDTEADLAWARKHVARLGDAAFPSFQNTIEAQNEDS